MGKKKGPSDIPISEWRKILAMLPEDIVQQTLNNTTHFYLSVEGENRKDLRRHYRYRFPGLRYPRQREKVVSNTFFLYLNHHMLILVHNYLWELYQKSGVYTPWVRKVKMLLP